uniref:Ovule protein n=1 Tax=Romanomermis culicivorax TaxID=13658 RepID=A0A915IWQ3_ROMCU
MTKICQIQNGRLTMLLQHPINTFLVIYEAKEIANQNLRYNMANVQKSVYNNYHQGLNQHPQGLFSRNESRHQGPQSSFNIID